MKTLLAIFLLTFVLAQQPPIWPVRFQQDFVESYTTSSLHTVGKLWYDAERGMERMDRNNGKDDPYCGPISNHTTTPCHHLIRDGKRYIVWPLLRQCCFCCDASHGCSIMRQDWLKTSVFGGKELISGEYFNKWTMDEAMTRYWSTIDSKQIPRKITEDNLLIKDFIMNTYSEEYIASSVFELPSYCSPSNLCPSDSKCGTMRGEATK